MFNQFGPGTFIFKVDISCAFHHIPNNSGDIDLLGLQRRDKLYLYLKTTFRYHLISIFFSENQQFNQVYHEQNSYTGLQNYIDDLIYIGLPSELHMNLYFPSFNSLVYWCSKKRCPPNTKVTCLGIEFDREKQIMSRITCVRSSRLCLNCMLQLLRDNSHSNMMTFTREFRKDLHWFNVFFSHIMGLLCII